MIRRLHSTVDVNQICSDGTQIDLAVERAARDARLKHKQMGVPLVVWRDGKVVEIPPEEIIVDPPTEPNRDDS
jgi:hypothetical protein